MAKEKIRFRTKCCCGASVRGEAQWPKLFQNTYGKMTCQVCDSRYLLTFIKEKGQVRNEVHILNLTSFAKDIQRVKNDDERRSV